MEELLEDYKRRLRNIEAILPLVTIGLAFETNRRLSIKASCYRTFISELEREIAKTKQS